LILILLATGRVREISASSGARGRVSRLFLRNHDADVSDDSERIRARAPYSAITSRPRLRLPGDARVAVWTIVNVESWSPAFAMPRTVLPPPMSGALLPDIPNWAWHEYGMRSVSGASSRRWAHAG